VIRRTRVLVNLLEKEHASTFTCSVYVRIRVDAGVNFFVIAHLAELCVNHSIQS